MIDEYSSKSPKLKCTCGALREVFETKCGVCMNKKAIKKLKNKIMTLDNKSLLKDVFDGHVSGVKSLKGAFRKAKKRLK